MDPDDPQLAVLYALQSVTQTEPAPTCARLLSALPKTLRDRWSARYLADQVLRKLINKEMVVTMKVGPGLIGYRLTPVAETLLNPPDVPVPPEPHSVSE